MENCYLIFINSILKKKIIGSIYAILHETSHALISGEIEFQAFSKSSVEGGLKWRISYLYRSIWSTCIEPIVLDRVRRDKGRVRISSVTFQRLRSAVVRYC